MSNVTLVTGLWDLGRGALSEGWGRDFESHYLSKFKDILKIPTNLIIFGDSELREFVNVHKTHNEIQFIERNLDWFKGNFYEKIQNATITFTMSDVETKVKRISCSPAFLEMMISNNCEQTETPSYYITYQFTEQQTSRDGRYNGYFTITFLDGTGTLIAPIRDELYINVLNN